MNAALAAALSGVASASSAALSILGLLLVFVVAVWGLLHVYAHLTGESSSAVFYKVGRIFGEDVYENRYERYRARRDRSRQFSRRYRDDHRE